MSKTIEKLNKHPFIFSIMLMGSIASIIALIFFLIDKNEAPKPSGPIKSQTKVKTDSILKNIIPQDDIAQDQKRTWSTDYLMGKFDPVKHPDFVKIASQYASNNTMRLRKETYESFKKMYTAAKKDGITLQIISATRPFSHQKRIWEAKWNGVRKVEGKDLSKTEPNLVKRALKILEYSSMPGSSRHHWGTDIDINALTNEYFEKGKGKKEYDWLVENASKFGFCQPYSPKGDARPYGYFEEKWHWSYLPISLKLTKAYNSQIKNEDITGFKGAETAAEIDIIQKFVLGISQDCL